MEQTGIKQFTFYEVYAELLDVLNDNERGKMLRRMCEFMFEDKEQSELEDKKLKFIWGNIADYMEAEKKAQMKGKAQRVLNRQMKHFPFYRNFYEATELMEEKQAGQYVKTIYEYMFYGKEVKANTSVEMYYKLAKRKLEISKIRKTAGKKGGEAERIKVTDEEIMRETERNNPVTFEEFMSLHPNIKNDLYRSRMQLLNGINWAWLDMGLDKYTEYKKCNSLYQILTHYREIISRI